MSENKNIHYKPLQPCSEYHYIICQKKDYLTGILSILA